MGSYSSLTGSDLIRSLCRQLGVQPQMRRSDNVANIHAEAALGSAVTADPALNGFFLQQEVAEYAQTFVEFPPMQRGASFNLDAVKAEIQERIRAMKGKME